MSVETLGVIVGMVVSLGIAWPVFRSKQTGATITLLSSELAIEKETRVAQQHRCDETLKEQDRRHSVEIAELRGQVTAMTPEFARVIASTLAPLLKEHPHP